MLAELFDAPRERCVFRRLIPGQGGSDAKSRSSSSSADPETSSWRSGYGRLSYATPTGLGANNGGFARTWRSQHAADHDGFPAERTDDPATDEPTMARTPV